MVATLLCPSGENPCPSLDFAEDIELTADSNNDLQDYNRNSRQYGFISNGKQDWQKTKSWVAPTATAKLRFMEINGKQMEVSSFKYPVQRWQLHGRNPHQD